MLRKAAASARNAARAWASEMREYSATFERPSGGSAKLGPTSSMPGGARRRASGATAVAQAASDLAAQLLHKDPKVTAVMVQAVDPADWFCAGHSLAQGGLAAFWLEIRITEGTNTKDEKAAFIAAVFKRMGELLGSLHANSYVYAHDARADGYGFSGLTQERRYVAGKLGTNLSAAA
jgi:4-oxalocrotonate tautomerase